MPYAHKLKTYRDDTFRNATFCQVCGHETNLSGPCPGEYQLSAKETAYIDREFNVGLKKIFVSLPMGSKTKAKNLPKVRLDKVITRS